MDTKELIKNPNETLDNVIKMVTQWDTQSMSYRQEKGIHQQKHTDVNKQMTVNIMCNMLDLPLQNDESMDDTCPYCEKPRHTREQCWMRKSDEDLEDPYTPSKVLQLGETESKN